MTKSKINKLIGEQSESDSNELIRSMRFHQSWWRTCVLGEEQGKHPMVKEAEKGKEIGSSILEGEKSLSNYLDEYAVRAINDTLEERKANNAKGIIKKDRLYNNLLSSQPLCFNFFGRLKYNKQLATLIIQRFYPDVATVTNVLFEFAPNAAENNDNSAHDIALEFVGKNGERGLIGLECKYTEPFSQADYDKPEYKKIYDLSNAFEADYEDLIHRKYNQLFRNQLIVESAQLNEKYDIVLSGLFYFEEDENARNTGETFQQMLGNGKNRFKLISYRSFLEHLQQLNLDWETREWTMMLWARYCGKELSKRFRE